MSKELRRIDKEYWNQLLSLEVEPPQEVMERIFQQLNQNETMSRLDEITYIKFYSQFYEHTDLGGHSDDEIHQIYITIKTQLP